MNGVHDLGGLQGFGPVRPESDEPLFHDAWEARALALTVAMGATGAWNLDQMRHARESLPPAEYLSFSYYRIWFEALQRMLQARGLVEAGEVQAGQSLTPARPVPRVLAAQQVAAALAAGSPTHRPITHAARFAPGDRVRARNVHPTGHTRLPRYARGHAGRVVAVHGAHVLPDENALGSERSAWLYTVRFEARTLWGEDTTADAVYLDAFEPYLELVEAQAVE